MYNQSLRVYAALAFLAFTVGVRKHLCCPCFLKVSHCHSVLVPVTATHRNGWMALPERRTPFLVNRPAGGSRDHLLTLCWAMAIVNLWLCVPDGVLCLSQRRRGRGCWVANSEQLSFLSWSLHWARVSDLFPFHLNMLFVRHAPFPLVSSWYGR